MKKFYVEIDDFEARVRGPVGQEEDSPEWIDERFCGTILVERDGVGGITNALVQRSGDPLKIDDPSKATWSKIIGVKQTGSCGKREFAELRWGDVLKKVISEDAQKDLKARRDLKARHDAAACLGFLLEACRKEIRSVYPFHEVVVVLRCPYFLIDYQQLPDTMNAQAVEDAVRTPRLHLDQVFGACAGVAGLLDHDIEVRKAGLIAAGQQGGSGKASGGKSAEYHGQLDFWEKGFSVTWRGPGGGREAVPCYSSWDKASGVSVGQPTKGTLFRTKVLDLPLEHSHNTVLHCHQSSVSLDKLLQSPRENKSKGKDVLRSFLVPDGNNRDEALCYKDSDLLKFVTEKNGDQASKITRPGDWSLKGEQAKGEQEDVNTWGSVRKIQCKVDGICVLPFTRDGETDNVTVTLSASLREDETKREGLFTFEVSKEADGGYGCSAWLNGRFLALERKVNGGDNAPPLKLLPVEGLRYRLFVDDDSRDVWELTQRLEPLLRSGVYVAPRVTGGSWEVAAGAQDDGEAAEQEAPEVPPAPEAGAAVDHAD